MPCLSRDRGAFVLRFGRKDASCGANGEIANAITETADPRLRRRVLAKLIFHQGLWSVFNHARIISWDRPAWPLDPIPPLGVPALLSKAFWGGVWGLVLTLILGRLGGASYWLPWIVVGAVALTVVSFFVVSPLKGQPHPSAVWPRFFVGLALNGAWGFGTGLLLWGLAGAAPLTRRP